MTNFEFLQYLNLALKQSNLNEKQQDEIWFDTKQLLDQYTVEQVKKLLDNY